MAYAKSKVLILGGNSLIGKHISDTAVKKEREVLLTRRRPIKVVEPSFKVLSLDVSSRKSIDTFLESVRQLHFERIICLIGKTSVDSKGESKNQLEQYYMTYTLNLSNLILELSSNNPSSNGASQMTTVASRSAEFGSYDLHYSTVKGALVRFTKSPGLKINLPKMVVSFSPGLVSKSSMFNQMSKEIQESHQTRSGYKLLSVEEASREIWRLSLMNSIDYVPGGNYSIGSVYQ